MKTRANPEMLDIKRIAMFLVNPYLTYIFVIMHLSQSSQLPELIENWNTCNTYGAQIKVIRFY